MGCHHRLLFLLVLVTVQPKCQSWGGWFFYSTGTESSDTHTKTDDDSNMGVAKFSIDVLNDPKGHTRVEKAKRRLDASNSCWQNAYRHLFGGCSEIIAMEDKQSRFAWQLSDCFQKESGRPPFPGCDAKSGMVNCLAKLNDHEHQIYLQFLLETKSICYQLQAHAFRHETERLVNDLKDSAQYAEERLENLEEKSDRLLQSSSQLHDSLSSADLRIENMARETQNVGDHMDILSKHSRAVYEQSKEIAASQSELREGQAKMKDKLEEGMVELHDAYSSLGQEVDNLRNEAIEIEKEIGKVGETLSLRMINLQEKADDIGNMAGMSLDKQRQLLDGQSTALKGLESLTEFQSEALEESRSALQQLAEFGHKQQEELLKRQEQLQQVHNHLVESSKSILAAQEAFESKQASMFIALDKLFALHNAMLLESRIIKAFVIYFLSIFIIYMFTSTKQTYTVRPRLYIELCAAFLIEVAILRLTSNDIEKQTWIVNMIRSLFALLASVQFLHAIYTYRDYEVLNHQILLTLTDKINGILRDKELLLSYDADSDVDWPSWLHSELPEDMDSDPDFEPDEFVEQEGDNSITDMPLKKTYDLRRRYYLQYS